MSQTTLEYLSNHHDHILDELIEFASIPSVSTDPAFQPEMERAARWVADQLEHSGLSGIRLIPTKRHPIVYGEWLGAPDKPTIIIYGHYDVQPSDPLDKWMSDPFRPEVRDDRLYARGISDDKGPLFIPIKLAQAFLARQGALPLNVKFLIEGEEEIGSPSLELFIRENADLLAAD